MMTPERLRQRRRERNEARRLEVMLADMRKFNEELAAERRQRLIEGQAEYEARLQQLRRMRVRAVEIGAASGLAAFALIVFVGWWFA